MVMIKINRELLSIITGTTLVVIIEIIIYIIIYITNLESLIEIIHIITLILVLIAMALIGGFVGEYYTTKSSSPLITTYTLDQNPDDKIMFAVILTCLLVIPLLELITHLKLIIGLIIQYYVQILFTIIILISCILIVYILIKIYKRSYNILFDFISKYLISGESKKEDGSQIA